MAGNLLSNNFENIKNEIKLNSPKPEKVELLAVSKKQSVEQIKSLYELGQKKFGENYLQEFLDKRDKINHLKIEWHYIGAIQSKKIRPIVENFSWIQTLDNLKHIKVLQKHAQDLKKKMNILIEVNVAGESSKGGINPNEINIFADEILSCPNLQLRGIMVFPPLGGEEKWFKLANEIFKALQDKLGDSIDTLSMGTSDDFKVAVKFGSTMVRLGTILFGPRVI